ncbi:MAG: Holliday junction resolvase RuvX [Rhodospirillales bacterium]|nr:MAG: Holliday junction resolvase RuvX [Rhodospirillales bacterium]
MPLVPLTDLAAALPPGRRLMGLDVGSRTIGLALSDVGRTIATPWDTIRRSRFRADAERLKDLFEAQEVGGLVVGLPVQMDGREGPRCQSVRQFTRDLLAVTALPAAFWDERLSTRGVERMLITEADMSRRRRAQVIDKLAAAYILQGALDALSRLRARPIPDAP